MTSRHNPKTSKGSAKAGAWTDAENAAVIALYVTIQREVITNGRGTKAGVIREIRGEPKATDPRIIPVEIRGELAMRSRGSVEAKMMNLSHVLAQSDDPKAGRLTLAANGYKALSGCQAALFDAVVEALPRIEI